MPLRNLRAGIFTSYSSTIRPPITSDMQHAVHPTDGKAAHDQLRRAACLINANQFDAAVAELTDVVDSPAAIATDPFGWFYENRRATFPSVAQLRALIAEDLENPELHFQLGLCLAREGRLEEAELRFTQSVSIHRSHSDALVGLGLCRYASGDVEGAVRFLGQAQASRPDDPRISLLWARFAGIAKQRGSIMDLCATVTVD